MTMTIVPVEKLKDDPQRLLYRFPNMNAVRYHKMQEEYSFWKTVQVAELVASMSGLLVVPSSCIHWQRKMELDVQRRIVIKKRAFYLLPESDMTEMEKKKYRLWYVDFSAKNEPLS